MIIGILGFGSIGKRHAKSNRFKKKVLIFDTNKKKKMKLKGWAANSYLIRKIL